MIIRPHLPGRVFFFVPPVECKGIPPGIPCVTLHRFLGKLKKNAFDVRVKISNKYFVCVITLLCNQFTVTPIVSFLAISSTGKCTYLLTRLLCKHDKTIVNWACETTRSRFPRRCSIVSRLSFVRQLPVRVSAICNNQVWISFWFYLLKSRDQFVSIKNCLWFNNILIS